MPRGHRVAGIWNVFDDWLAEQPPSIQRDLHPPASKDQLRALSNALGVPLPNDLIALLERNDGQRRSGQRLFGDMSLMGSSDIAMDWNVLTDLAQQGDFDGRAVAASAGIRPTWWSPGWIPFAVSSSGDHLCIDVAPAPGGKAGQVISFYHDLPDREYLATDLVSWLNQWISATRR